MQDRHRKLAAWLGVGLAAFLAAGGCGVLNPMLVSSTGANTVNSLPPPQGYVVILVMNRTTVAVQATVRITKSNGTVVDRTFKVGALRFLADVQDCDTASVLFDNFSDGTNITPANLGTLQNGTGFNCGSVISVTADGNPPTYTVEVF